MENLRVGLVQFAPSDDAADNREFLDSAFDLFDDVDLIVLPEYSAWYDEDTSRWADGAEPIDGEFVSFLRGNAARRNATIVAGMLVSRTSGVTNTVVAVDATGVVGEYDKVHLYDAFGAMESEYITAGDPNSEPLVFDVRGWSVGAQTCYDLRFPESSRRLIDAGASVIVVPSDWVPGPNKSHHWRTLLQARAIENLAWVVAVNHAEPSGIGESMVVDPRGNVVVDTATDLWVCSLPLDPDAVPAARLANPALDNRRFRTISR